MASHTVTYRDFETDGGNRGGTVAECTCGWSDRWWTRDGSAQQSGGAHQSAMQRQGAGR